MLRGLLLDFHGTVVEDDDAIIEAVAGEVAAGAAWAGRPVAYEIRSLAGLAQAVSRQT